MAITLNDNIFTDAPKASDSRYGTYTSLADALSSVSTGNRYQGLTVGIVESGSVSEYWFKNGTTDNDLIAKIPDSFIYRHEFVDGVPATDYVGKAVNDSLESDAVWTIKKLTIASDGSSTVATATDVDWTNRATHTYS
jgi:hypothetical protein